MNVLINNSNNYAHPTLAVQTPSTTHSERDNFVEVSQHNDIMKCQWDFQNKITPNS